MTPPLSIIVVHHKAPEFLKLCLKSINDTVHNIDHEVIVVDSACTRASRDIVREWEEKFERLHYIPATYNLGYARGVNMGLARAEGEYILILNPDIVLTEGAAASMKNYMAEHDDIGLLGPQMLNFNGTHQQNYFRFYTPATVLARRSFLGKFWRMRSAVGRFLMLDTDPAEIQTPNWIMGSTLMLRRSALAKVGKMDERFFMYFEDVDWARRFWHNGYKVVYYPKAVVYHYHQRQSKSRLGILDALFNQKTRWHIASAFKFFIKYRTLEVVKNQ